MKITQTMWLGIAILMVIPIVMVILSLTLNNPANRWANIIVAIVFFGFNLISTFALGRSLAERHG